MTRRDVPRATPRAIPRARGRGRALLMVAAALVAVAVTMLLVADTAPAQGRAPREVQAVARKRPLPNDRTRRADTADVVIEREAFAYASGGRRDPFRSLLTTSDLRPLLAELRLVAVAVDPADRNSVAILRDLTTKAQHRVRAGQMLGRMRVSQIRARAVVFTIEELGYSRQETLALSDSTVARTK